jgi:hypothetical protein
MLSFYANLLLKLSLTQSILITTFTSWIQSLWCGVPCCQHIPPSVTGSSASLIAACWKKLLPLLPWCSVSNRPLSLVSFRTPCSCDILREGSIATRDTRSDEVPTKYPLSQDRIIVFGIHLHSKSPMLYRPALHDNRNALSLDSRALKDKFPTPTIPLTTVLQNRQVFLLHPIEVLVMCGSGMV